MIKFGEQVPKIPNNFGGLDLFRSYGNHTSVSKLGNENKEEKDGNFSGLLARPFMQEFEISKFDYLNEMQHSCVMLTANSKLGEGREKREFELTTNHAYRCLFSIKVLSLKLIFLVCWI